MITPSPTFCFALMSSISG